MTRSLPLDQSNRTVAVTKRGGNPPGKGSNLAEFCGDQLHRSRATGRDDGGSDRVGLVVGGWGIH